jgi:acyl-coenzyme A synthetase/AMP-(fatty) acid ligase
MWAIVLCGLSYGGSLVLYDGSPLYPDPLVTLRLVEELKYGYPEPSNHLRVADSSL